MPVETRYFRSDTEVVGALTFYRLLTTNTAVYATESQSWETVAQVTQAYLRCLIYVYHQDDTCLATHI